jgi:hypothetical protein
MESDMNESHDINDISASDETLIDLISRVPDSNSLESLFTPLQQNNPVESFVRRT